MQLKEAISIILNEWNIQHKDEISKGIGTRKKVFPLKSNPDYVVKQIITLDDHQKHLLKKEIDFCIAHPNICAKILKFDIEKGYVIQERLDTGKFLKELYAAARILKKDLKLQKIKYLVQGEEANDKLSSFIAYLSHEVDWRLKPFEEIFEKNSFGFKIFMFCDEILYLQITDSHENNVGLDKFGNIKLLDI